MSSRRLCTAAPHCTGPGNEFRVRASGADRGCRATCGVNGKHNGHLSSTLRLQVRMQRARSKARGFEMDLHLKQCTVFLRFLLPIEAKISGFY